MKIPTLITFALLTLSQSCGTRGDDKQSEDQNDALYQEVMSIHDEVMPRMDEIYRIRQELVRQIEEAPEMVEERRRAIEARIIKLDSAADAMMVWMRQFNPPDSLEGRETRNYLEEQKEKITEVRDLLLEAINATE